MGHGPDMACAYLGLDCRVFMVKCSYEQKPFRREVMRTYGACVTPSPSDTTQVGRDILRRFPETTGSLGCAISEAVEYAAGRQDYRYVLGSVLNQVLLHQSVIGLETKLALDKYGVHPDIIIGCAGGGSNLGGLIAPFVGEMLRGEARYEFIAVEPASCPSFTRGKYAYDFCDTGAVCPLAKMYTLGSASPPPPTTPEEGQGAHGLIAGIPEGAGQGDRGCPGLSGPPSRVKLALVKQGGAGGGVGRVGIADADLALPGGQPAGRGRSGVGVIGGEVEAVAERSSCCCWRCSLGRGPCRRWCGCAAGRRW